MALQFGTDGVRGVANRDLTPELVLALGRALVRVLGSDRPLLVARDTRVSGTMLEAALSAGVNAEGGSVQSAGILPTPGLAHLARLYDFPAAMISASHNPYTDNGIKVFAPGGTKIDDEREAAIEATLRAVLDRGAGASDVPVGTSTRVAGSIDRYAVYLMETLEGRTLDGLRVVLDCANGAAYGVAPKVFRDLGAAVETLNTTPDGTNINVECGSTHPAALQEAVRAAGATLGVAFDGDADRMIAVDEAGNVVDGDHVMAMCAIDLHERGLLDHDAIVATVMSNLGLTRALEPYGVAVVVTGVGDRAVTDAMRERGLVLGGEESGHLVFARHAPVGDGTLSALMVADLMLRSGRPLSDLAGVVRKLPQVRHNVAASSDAADAPSVGAAVAAAEEELAGDGRVLLRPSGTEPIVRVMVEATDAAVAEQIASRLVAAVQRAGGGADTRA